MKIKKINTKNLRELEESASYARMRLERALQVEVQTLEDYICKKYIEIQNVSGVAKEFNDMGERIHGRKYLGKDISNLIRRHKETDVGRVANAILEHNNTLQNGRTTLGRFIKSLRGGGKH